MKANEKKTVPFSEFVCTINEIEKRTKLDFFFKLDDELEERLEQSCYTP